SWSWMRWAMSVQQAKIIALESSGSAPASTGVASTRSSIREFTVSACISRGYTLSLATTVVDRREFANSPTRPERIQPARPGPFRRQHGWISAGGLARPARSAGPRYSHPGQPQDPGNPGYRLVDTPAVDGVPQPPQHRQQPAEPKTSTRSAHVRGQVRPGETLSDPAVRRIGGVFTTGRGKMPGRHQPA